VLSREENELLTRVGPGTPMGNLLRCFWLPVALASELAEAEGAALRPRVLGEDLTVWRDADGVAKAAANPIKERGGVVWAYLGAPKDAPGLPELEWTHVPASHRYVSKRIQQCNYLQNVEGEVDSSHVSFLHSKGTAADAAGIQSTRSPQPDYMARDRAPRFFVLQTEYGMQIGARRNADDDSYYWRVTQFLMPTFTIIPVPVGAPLSFTAATPIDDEHMMGFTVTWHPDRPLRDDEIAQIESWLGVHTEVDPISFIPVRNKSNDYLIDRALQRSGRSYTGIRGIREEDMAVQESMGPIFDRTTEHLGSSDLAVIAIRRRLLEAVRALAERGEIPYESRNADAYRVRSAALVLPRDVEWYEGAAQALTATM
jgi:phthalate 4,5-dioxygenase